MSSQEDILTIFGSNITKQRVMHSITQEELAAKIDLTPREITGIESGKHWTKADKIEKICDLFEISYYQLFEGAKKTTAADDNGNKMPDRKPAEESPETKLHSQELIVKPGEKLITKPELYIPVGRVLGINLIHLRKKAGMSQKDLSRASNVCEKSISNIENATVWPSAAVLQRLVDILQVPVRKLFATPIMVSAYDLALCIYNLNHHELALFIEQLTMRLIELQDDDY
ncbi:helix-turn-helix transcriptional regulator [Treponema sp.]|uniref:helix-turn-helix transcriptional regulator n=1 Tax=Treponema sp. TaxID=166 RepID=UPI0025D220D5|nr:helix-turn-helix transcriptional regulator [Treponema sp.]MCR5218222.1 helix-turn-helix domain-containing protein [Treponema sp.]